MKCSVCNDEEELGTVSSAVGPMSFPIGKMCLSNNAEPESSFIYLYEDVGDHGEGIAEHVNALSTYSGGHYVSWPDWRNTRRQIGGLPAL